MDTEAEEIVLGTIIQNPEALRRASEMLSPDDFWGEQTEQIYSTCISLFDTKGAVDKNTLISTLKTQGILDQVGGEKYIEKLVSAANIVLFPSNLSKVKNLSILRAIMHFANNVLKQISENQDANQLLQQMSAEIGSLERRITKLPPRITKLQIHTTNPRSYKIIFSDGREVDINIEDIMSPKKVKEKIINTLDFVPSLPYEAKDWEKFVKYLMDNAEVIAQNSVDLNKDILDAIKDMLTTRGEAKIASDLRTGAYAREEIDGKEYLLFQKRAAVSYIKQHLDKNIDTVDLWRIIQNYGAINNKGGKPLAKRIGNDTRTGLWAIPATLMNETLDDGFERRGSEIDVSDWGV
jgi:hypothetical protein